MRALACVVSLVVLTAQVAEAQVCGRGLSDVTVSGSQVLNTFHPAPSGVTTAVLAGATSIPVAAARAGGGAAIATGDLLVVMQMQGAEIDQRQEGTTNGLYGDGALGADRRGVIAGATFRAGLWEYARAAGPVTAGSVPLMAGLTRAYLSTDAVTAGGNIGSGAHRYQVVRVIEVRDLTIPVGATLTSVPWDGASGGLVAIDAARNLVVNGTIDVMGMGFRGGTPSSIPAGTPGTETDTGGITCGKGEGIAGRPPRLYSRLGGVVTGADLLYGSNSERGGPGNAGGCPIAGDSGGGGGGGGRQGGVGSVGPSANADPNVPRPGEGYAVLDRLLMGGGGGSGSLDDPAVRAAVSGQAGGGIVLVRATNLSGAGVIRADGDSGGTQPQEGAGGGGGGGGIFIFTNSTNFAGISIRSRGGNGGATQTTDDGGGGGGGGGFVLVATPTGLATVTIDVTGGAGGTSPTQNGGAGTGGFQQVNIPPLGTPPCPVQCSLPTHCNDGNGCTTDTCNSGTCSNASVTAGLPGACAGALVCSGAPSNTCVQCVTNAQCSGATPICDSANVCRAAPVVLAPANGSQTNNQRPVISGTAQANSTVTILVDGASIGTTTATAAGTFSFTPAANIAGGTHTVQVTAGAPALPSNTNTFTIDLVAPDTIIVAGPNGTVASTSATFDFSSNEAGVSFQCSLDGAPFAACTDPVTFTGLSQGNHNLLVRAVDAAGNVDPTPAPRAWVVDTVAPDTLIVSGPSGTVASANANFDFASNEAGATFQCSLDGAAFVVCADPSTFTGLADGPHTLSVRAVDAAGNVDPTPVTRSWTIDTVAPDTNIVSGPSGSVASTTATFDFSSPDATATFQCSLDGAAFTACSDPITFTGLSQGPHTLQVRAIDPAGNVDPTPVTRAWTVDTVQPDTTIVSGPSGTVTSPSATFDFGSNETNVTYQCSLDGAAFTACSDPVTFTGLADGPHTLQVRAVDAAGNTDPTPVSRSWSIDSVPPDTNIIAGPNGSVASTTATFDFSSEAGATFQCSLDGAAFTACTDPVTFTGLSQGPHTLLVRAVDAAGNVDPTPASRGWTVDTVVPDTLIVSGPTGAVNSTTATFDLSSPEAGVSYQCSLDGSAFTACSDPVTFTGLAQGSHTFSARAVDAAGNVDPTPVTRTWSIDLTPPDTSIVSGPSGSTTSTTATFDFASPETGVTFECAIDGAAFAACADPLTLTGLAQGNHTLQVRAVDAAGNVDPSPAPASWTVDTSAPDTTIVSGPSGSVRTTSATFDFGSNEPNVTFQCALDGAAFTACSDPSTFTGLTDGSHTLQVRAVDAAGNVDPTPISRTWTVDTTAPDTNIVSGPTGTVSSADATFDFSSPETGVTFECALDGNTFVACTDPVTFPGLADGSHTLLVRAVDAAGNVDPTPISRTWTVDTGLPDTTIAMGPSGSVNSNSATFDFTSNEMNVTYECRLDAAATFTACTDPVTFSMLSEGSHTLAVRAKDGSGNVDPSPATRTWTVDTTAPDTSIAMGPMGTVSSNMATFDFDSPESSVTYECKLDGAATFTACTDPVTFSNLADGSHTLEVRAVDAAGNVDATPATRTWVVNASDPDTFFVLTPPATSASTNATFDFGSNESGVTYECKLDGAMTFTACTDPVTFMMLAAGSHTLEVRAVDSAGARDATPARYTWTVNVGMDMDGDGLPDDEERMKGTNPNDADSDDDGVPDGAERSWDVDTDGDGLINALDPDSDNDGLFDGTEQGVATAGPATDTTRGHFIPDADPTTRTNPLAADTDMGGLDDGAEDTNKNGRIDAGEKNPNDPSDDTSTPPVDTDMDGLTDAEEMTKGTNPMDADSDDDGVIDGQEPNWADDTDRDGRINALDPDSDGDGLKDGTELGVTMPNRDTNVGAGNFVADADPSTKTSAVAVDTDRGGLSDGVEDTNLNGRRDAGERNPLDPADDRGTDTDMDGLTDDEERMAGTDPMDADSDDDGVIDGREPRWNIDSDGDGLINALDPDSDNDGLLDGTELGVATPPTGTDVSRGHFRADADPTTTTDPTKADTDNGGVNDGAEDPNRNGRIDAGERNPNDPSDDAMRPVDSDMDGLTDDQERAAGTNPMDADSDDDGVKDGAEPNWSDDTDGDGLINALDPDSDNDRLFDGTEQGVTAPVAGATDTTRGFFVADADPSTKTNPLLRDTDRGGVPDGTEDTNKNGRIDMGERNPNDPSDDGSSGDMDGDGIPDDEERRAGTNPNDADTDDDGVKDGDEPNWNVDSDGDGLINARDPDSDDDGLKDGTELGVTMAPTGTDVTKGNFVPDADPTTRTNALDRDTDKGGVPDGAEDTNKNGRVDMGEKNPLDPSDDVNKPNDGDNDGLTDDEERMAGTNPGDADSDDDGVRDGDENNWNADTDGDGKINALDPDSDDDGLKDGTERGVTMPGSDTDVSKGNFVADEDSTTKTSPLLPDTDGGTVNDGVEDTNKNGRVDMGERNPNDPADDLITTMVENLCPTLEVDFDGDGVDDRCDPIVIRYAGGGCSSTPGGWVMLAGLITLLARRRRSAQR